MAIIESLHSFGYVLTPVVAGNDRVLYITGGKLGKIRALLVDQDGKSINCGLAIGTESGVSADMRYDVLAQFMEVNFSSIWAHISGSKQAKPKDMLYFVETAIFLEEMNQANLDSIMVSLITTAFRASEILAQHDALESFNPFHDQIAARNASKSKPDSVVP